MSDLIRLVVIAGYMILTVAALYSVVTLKWIPRRVISFAVLAVSFMWMLFYLVLVPFVLENPSWRSLGGVVSRVIHLPTIAALGMTLYIINLVERRR